MAKEAAVGNLHNALVLWKNLTGVSRESFSKEELGLIEHALLNVSPLQVSQKVTSAMYIIPLNEPDTARLIAALMLDDKGKRVLEKVESRPKSKFFTSKSNIENLAARSNEIAARFNIEDNELTINDRVVLSALMQYDEEDIDGVIDECESIADVFWCIAENRKPVYVHTSEKNRATAEKIMKRQKDIEDRTAIASARRYAAKMSNKEGAENGEKNSGKGTPFTVQDLFLSADVEAEELLRQGKDRKHVIAYNNLAPKNYWLDVVRILDKSGGNITRELIYERLEKKYNWHPFDREVPDWA